MHRLNRLNHQGPHGHGARRPDRQSSDGELKRPPRVLVIEDTKIIQQLVAVTLRPLAVEIEARYDGASGLEAAIESSPDVIVLDIGLPGLTGWEVLTRLRSDPRTRHVRVLVLTAHAQEEVRTKALQDGADKFMTKPFLPQMLRDAIASLLDVHSTDTVHTNTEVG
jgi:CheY-like chemotaxis protein